MRICGTFMCICGAFMRICVVHLCVRMVHLCTHNMVHLCACVVYLCPIYSTHTYVHTLLHVVCGQRCVSQHSTKPMQIYALNKVMGKLEEDNFKAMKESRV